MIRMNTWFEAVNTCQNQGLSYVLITVITTAGSTPREVGAKMVVTAEAQFDTIGGGHLEFDAIKKAREFLLQKKHAQHIVSYPLASKLGQCCGGAVKILFEVHANHSQHLVVFGAGHVATALVPILAQLPFQITWIDSRHEMMNAAQQNTAGANVNYVISEDPCDEIPTLHEKSWIVVLTHNHQLDYDIVEQCLKRGIGQYLGMIGSTTKAKRFVSRLKHRGYSEQTIAKLICPIGDVNIPGKRPIEVAVSISSQIIQRLHMLTVQDTDVTIHERLPLIEKADDRDD